MIGDLSPLLPLSKLDAITINSALKIKMERENSLFTAIADLNFYLSRISMSLTGDGGMNFLPSEVDRMSRKYAERMKK